MKSLLFATIMTLAITAQADLTTNFTGDFAQSNWSVVREGDGTEVNTSKIWDWDFDQVIIFGVVNQIDLDPNLAIITIQIVAPEDGTLSFDWSFNDNVPEKNHPIFYLNSNITLMDGFDINGDIYQSGVKKQFIKQGETFGMGIRNLSSIDSSRYANLNIHSFSFESKYDLDGVYKGQSYKFSSDKN